MESGEDDRTFFSRARSGLDARRSIHSLFYPSQERSLNDQALKKTEECNTTQMEHLQLHPEIATARGENRSGSLSFRVNRSRRFVLLSSNGPGPLEKLIRHRHGRTGASTSSAYVLPVGFIFIAEIATVHEVTRLFIGRMILRATACVVRAKKDKGDPRAEVHFLLMTVNVAVQKKIYTWVHIFAHDFVPRMLRS